MLWSLPCLVVARRVEACNMCRCLIRQASAHGQDPLNFGNVFTSDADIVSAVMVELKCRGHEVKIILVSSLASSTRCSSRAPLSVYLFEFVSAIPSRPSSSTRGVFVATAVSPIFISPFVRCLRPLRPITMPCSHVGVRLLHSLLTVVLGSFSDIFLFYFSSFRLFLWHYRDCMDK